jgi:hypothetical protein
MTHPFVARPKRRLVTLNCGSSDFWYSCARATNQPFRCESHQCTEFRLRRCTAIPEGEEVPLCGCKQTRNAPLKTAPQNIT